jgi:hypothetical protein
MRFHFLFVVTTAASAVLPQALRAQQPAGRLSYAVPPSTWRITPLAEVIGEGETRATAQRPAGAPKGIRTSRVGVRVGLPTWKRGLYRTVVANEFSAERIGQSSRYATNLPSNTRGPADLQIFQHDLLVSQGLGPKWRVTGVLQHGFYPMMDAPITRGSYRAAGGGFVTRVYRPTLQVGFGVISLNVQPWVIPTIRVLHVGKRWRSDVLIPRAEAWYDVGGGVEVGAALRFLGNRWTAEGADVGVQSCICNITIPFRQTYTQAAIGPAMNVKLGGRGLLQLETGVAQRRILEDVRSQIIVGNSVTPFTPAAQRFDQTITPFLRLSVRASF